MQWFLNFQPSSTINITDRGLAYGDGLFETISASDGTIPNLHLHLTRLTRGLKRFGFKYEDRAIDELVIFLKEKAAELGDVGFKVIVTRGSGGRGYLPPEKTEFSWLVGVFELPDYNVAQQHGVKLTALSVQSSVNRSTAGLKHLNRLENVLAKQALKAPYFEAVLSDAFGSMVECIQSNVFWVKNGALYTPVLNVSGVQGTMRHRVIKAFPGVVNIVQQPSSKLLEADEIFVTNALSGVLPVIEYNGRQLSIGPVCRNLMEQLANIP